MSDERYTFVRDGQMYNADKDTVELIRSADRYDARPTKWNVEHRSIADYVFDHGRESGRITEGSALLKHHAAEQKVTERHAHGLEQ